jgi:predicted nucleotidyltransferase
MNVTGIIAEYNPFHNGHAYQLRELRESTQADYLIVAMSGDFMQRGCPAVMDKYARAQMALLGGADLVLELPVLWATASAEYFAAAGVQLLRSTGVVTTVGYGVETSDVDLPARVGQILNNPPEEYHSRITALQKDGLSYPMARAAALCEFCPEYERETLTEFLGSPNNILAVEYEKALAAQSTAGASSVKSYPLRRIGDDYHKAQPDSHYASATAIRNLLFSGADITGYVPETSQSILEAYRSQHAFLSERDLSLMLKYRLLTLQKEGYASFADCSPDLSCRIINHLGEYQDFSQFVSILKSKNMTWTRISRVLLHILLNLTQEDYQTYQGEERIPYLRVLGFRKEAEPLLSEVKKHAACPMITKAADASRVLSPKAYALLEKDFFASDIYQSMGCDRTGQCRKNEFTHEIVRC